MDKILKLLKDNMNKTCTGLECKVVKNNIDLRKENIQLKKQIDLMADKINENFSKIFFKYEIDEIKSIYYEKNKNITKLRGLDLRKDCIKQYFKNQIKEN